MARWLLILGLLAPAVRAEDPPLPLGVQLPRADDPTHFTPADRQAMLALVRGAATGDVAFDADTMPAKLLRETGHPVLVSAHRAGREPLVAWAVKGTLFEQFTTAARRLRQAGRLEHPGRTRFKIDIVTARAPLEVGAADGGVVLGIHGLRVRTPAEDALLPPSEALRLGLRDGEAFARHALGQVKAPRGGLREVALERLATASFIEREPGGGGPPVDLYRGRPLVGTVTPRRLRAACRAAGEWLLRFQRPDGSFHYSYNAATDEVGEGYSIVRHAGTAWSLVQAFEATGERRFLDGARRALEWLLKHQQTRGEMAWIQEDGRGSVGATALGVVALLAYREASRAKTFDGAIGRLGRFLVFMQRDDGFFFARFDPARDRRLVPEDRLPLYAPGEAFLALTRLQAVLPSPAWREAALRAADFAVTKRDDWFAERGLEVVHPDSWTMTALDGLRALGLARRPHVDYAFFLAHLALEEQVTPGESRWLDHVGAPRTHGEPPRSDVAAGRCEGLLAAWRLARRMGVATEGYRRAVMLSLRFQFRHQVDAVNGYLLPNPSRALGGFYASYADPTIRIDGVQHNLSSLSAALRLLEAEGQE